MSLCCFWADLDFSSFDLKYGPSGAITGPQYLQKNHLWALLGPNLIGPNIPMGLNILMGQNIPMDQYPN